MRRPTPSSRSGSPPVDIYEGDQEFVLIADMPGVPPDALELKLDPPELWIRGRSSAGDLPVDYQLSESIRPSIPVRAS